MYNPDRTVDFTTQPFGPNYKKGVRVAVGDVTGDGVSDIVAVTNGGVKAKARVINGATEAVLSNNLLGATSFMGKLSVAVGDITGDGVADIALGMDQAGPKVRVYRGGDFTKLTGFTAGPATNFIGRTTVAIGEMTGDTKADLVVSALYTGRTRVIGYNGATLAPGVIPQTAFTKFTLGGAYVSGLFLSVGDVNGDGRADLVIGTAATRKPKVAVYSGEALVEDNLQTKIATFTPAASSLKNGVRVAVRDINGDGTVDIITSSGEMVSGFEGGSSLPLTGLPPLMFAFDPLPALGGVFIG
jgi:hypothetical protein